MYVLLVGGLLNVLAAAGWVDVRVFGAVRGLALVGLLGALLGLTYHFVFLFTGRRVMLPLLALYYIGVYAFITYVTAGHRVIGVSVGQWDTQLLFDPVVDPMFHAAILGLILSPQALAVGSYLFLAVRAPEGPQRYRALLMGGGIAAWLTSAFLADLSPDDALQFVTGPILGLFAAVLVILAYDPPTWARERFGLRTAAEDAARPPQARM